MYTVQSSVFLGVFALYLRALSGYHYFGPESGRHFQSERRTPPSVARDKHLQIFSSMNIEVSVWRFCHTCPNQVFGLLLMLSSPFLLRVQRLRVLGRPQFRHRATRPPTWKQVQDLINIANYYLRFYTVAEENLFHHPGKIPTWSKVKCSGLSNSWSTGQHT